MLRDDGDFGSMASSPQARDGVGHRQHRCYERPIAQIDVKQSNESATFPPSRRQTFSNSLGKIVAAAELMPHVLSKKPRTGQ